MCPFTQVNATRNSQDQVIFRPYAPDTLYLIQRGVIADQRDHAFARGI